MGKSVDQQQAAPVFVEGEGSFQVRCGAAGICDLADERVVADQPELDRRGAVADGVGDQLADDQFGGVFRLG